MTWVGFAQMQICDLKKKKYRELHSYDSQDLISVQPQ